MRNPITFGLLTGTFAIVAINAIGAASLVYQLNPKATNTVLNVTEVSALGAGSTHRSISNGKVDFLTDFVLICAFASINFSVFVSIFMLTTCVSFAWIKTHKF